MGRKAIEQRSASSGRMLCSHSYRAGRLKWYAERGSAINFTRSHFLLPTYFAAIRDVILTAVKEQTYGGPTLANTKTESGTLVRAFCFEGVENAFVVLPFKEDTGETHSLGITRVPLH